MFLASTEPMSDVTISVSDTTPYESTTSEQFIISPGKAINIYVIKHPIAYHIV